MSARVRRRRFLGVTIVVVVLAVLAAFAAFAAARHGARRVPGVTAAGHASASPEAPRPSKDAALSAAAAAWRLPAPLSRSVVLPVEGKLTVLGGLGPRNRTESAVFEVDPQSGKVEQVGQLAQPAHDAAGAVIGTRLYVFGGGAASVSGGVQAIDAGAPPGTTATVVAQLPSPRADLAAVPVGDQVVLLGGYDGKASLADVLVTRDGTTFSRLAALPEPVRYPAAVAVGSKVLVVGGERDDKTDSTAVQEIDVAKRTSRIVAHLPAGISHATAVAVGGSVFVLGGRAKGRALDTITRIDPATGATAGVGRLPAAVSDSPAVVLGEVAYLVGGEGAAPVDGVVQGHLSSTGPDASSPDGSSFGRPVFDGHLLIADRGNNRLLVVGSDRKIVWEFPSAQAPAPAEGFYFPDDAFFTRGGTGIITNEEEQHTIIEIAYPSGKETASFGTSGKAGSAPGMLDQPDDAYLLKDGTVTVADAKNCRILFLKADLTYDSQIGTTGDCTHGPPKHIGYPNGDTPLADGNVLVSEIHGSYVTELTRDGRLVWTLHLPIAYPSDPQQIGPDLYLIADYAKPGGVYEFTREGQITFRYSPPSGEGMLDHPSLAELLPSGLIAVNDDYRHRVVLIDPATSKIVWQYGHTDEAGTAPGSLNTPDGFDLLAPDHSTPTHTQTG